jgi:hypothetical protein
MNTKSLYLQFLEQCWAITQDRDSTKQKFWQASRTQQELEKRAYRDRTQINESRHHIQQSYYLERRFLL